MQSLSTLTQVPGSCLTVALRKIKNTYMTS